MTLLSVMPFIFDNLTAATLIVYVVIGCLVYIIMTTDQATTKFWVAGFLGVVLLFGLILVLNGPNFEVILF